MLDKNKILAVNDTKPVKVSVPEWGGHVYLRVMRGDERMVFESLVNTDDMSFIREKLLCTCICDEEGGRIFADDDFKLLAAKSSRVINRLFEQAMAVNGIGEDSVEQEKKISRRTCR